MEVAGYTAVGNVVRVFSRFFWRLMTSTNPLGDPPLNAGSPIPEGGAGLFGSFMSGRVVNMRDQFFYP